MDHVAILDKKGRWLEKMLDGEKTIESRWYVNRVAPWDKVKVGDTVYFKESGRPVSAKAQVTKVIQYEGLDKSRVEEIVKKYGDQIAPGMSNKGFVEWVLEKGNKRYCILIFLRSVKRIKPFMIDKTGYGVSSAWLCVGNVDKLRK